MTTALERAAAQVAAEGRRLYARWDSERFERLCECQARMLWEKLAEQPNLSDASTLIAYLTLLREAVGAGYLSGPAKVAGDAGAGVQSFLEFSLLRLIPDSLVAEPPETRVNWLATVWNLAEGVRNGPPWIDGYVAAFTGELKAVHDIEKFLMHTLGPALEQTEPAAWNGPFTLAVVDTRAAHDPFLPGPMHLAAPTVLCVQDRRDPSVHLGILLRHGGRSKILGTFPALAAYGNESALPDVRAEDNRLRIGRHAVDLPYLGRPHQIALAGAGFVIASALDSQRLWVVESA
jgi:hypothetical protein